MTTLIKIIIATILSLTLFSCNFDMGWNPGVKGNGTVVTETRSVNGDFSSIKASEGLSVYLTQSNNESITVEADENLQKLILVEVNEGVLKIHTKKNIGRATSKKVLVSFKDINGIQSSSGCSVHSTNTISTENLDVKSSSGSSLKLKVNTNDLTCESSSGSSIKISGKTLNLTAEASSGSNIKAGDLNAESSKVKASSGAHLTVNTSKKLIAKATSGGGINYYGNPEVVDQDKSSGGSISGK